MTKFWNFIIKTLYAAIPVLWTVMKEAWVAWVSVKTKQLFWPISTEIGSPWTKENNVIRMKIKLVINWEI